MSTFTVWRSGSGHLNCWNALPLKWGEFEADTFIEACEKAVGQLYNLDSWVVEIVDGTMFIESDERHHFGHRVGRYGLYPTEEAAMAETLRRFDAENAEEYKRITGSSSITTELKCWERLSVPQQMYDSFGQSYIANVCLERSAMVTWGEVDNFSDSTSRLNSMLLDLCANCPLRNRHNNSN